MRSETVGKQDRKLGDISGHDCRRGDHNRATEICKVNWKSNPELTSTDKDRISPNKLPSSDDSSAKIGTVKVTDKDSDDCKMAVGTDSSKDADSDMNKTTVVTENKENEANGVIVTQREKDFSKRQEKQSDVSDDESSSEDSENECTEENKEEVAKKPVLNINIPSDSVSNVENQLKTLTITQTEDGDLCERSPMGSERQRVRGDPPYPQVTSHLRCNGGGIVAESPALTDCLYSVSPPLILYNNINELAEQNNNVLLQPGPEYPFGEASSLSEANNNFMLTTSPSCLYDEAFSPLPNLEQKDLDAWLIVNDSNMDKQNTGNMNDSHQGHGEVRDDLEYSNSFSIHAERNEVFQGSAWPNSLSNHLQYRDLESIASLSPPSSGSRSECSPSSSPVPSLADSFPGKSDSDTENELLTTDLMRIGHGSPSYVPSCSAPCMNDMSPNKYMTSSAVSGDPCCPLVSGPFTCFTTSHSAISEKLVQPTQSVINVQSVEPPNPPVSVLLAGPAQAPQRSSCLYSAHPLNYLPTKLVQSTPSVGTMMLAQPAVKFQQTQPTPPTATSVPPGCQNIPVPSSASTQAVIRRPVQPYMSSNLAIILPGPVTPKTVSVSARERIASKMDKAMKDRVVMTLARLTDDQLSKGDEHGDTQLMILIANDHQHKLEQIYVMVSRLKNIPGALRDRNAQNQSALSLACVFLNQMPFVARFIAEVMLEKGLPVNEVYDEGNTLLHMLCSHGDSHVGILAELLSMKDGNNAPCFDINQHNHKEGTPLHVAVKKHSKKVNCSRTVDFLLRQGADVLAKERSCGLTVLHLAIKESCDPLLVQIILQAAERRNINLEIQKILHRR